MPDDASDPTPRLRRDFGDLRGDALVAHLAEHSNWTAMELLWRAGEAALAVRIAVDMATSDDTRLSDLMLHELLAPTMDPSPVRTAIFDAITGRWPRLSGDAVREIDEALRDASNAIPAVAARRDLMESWLLNQPGPIADAYAIWVIRGASPVPHGTTVAASVARCKANAKLRAQAATEYRSQLAETPDANSWNRAAGFIESACAADDKAGEITGLVADLVSTSPAIVVAGPFQTVITQLIYKRGGPTLLGLLEGPELPVTPGVEALLALVETWPNEAERLHFLTRTLRKQATLWPLVVPIVSAWSPECWSELLATILGMPEEDVPETMSSLFTLAPETVSATLMEIVSRHPRPSDPALFAVLVAKALAHFRLIAKDNQEAIAADPSSSPVARPVDALWWPKEGDESGLRLLTEVMASFGSAAEQVQVLVDVYDDRRATAGMVAAAIHDAVITPFVLEARARSPQARGLFRVVAQAVRDNRPGLFGSAASSMQAQSFDIDIAAVMAPTDPGTAFAKSEAAYESMSEQDREELLRLLEQFGGPGQVPTIERFAEATGKQDRARRARAFAIYARVAPTGSVPASVHEGMRVTAPEVREAAFSAVTDLRPRDLGLVREIRDLAGTDGNVARLATRTLDALCDYFIGILSGDIAEQERIQLLGVLGAAARPGVVDILLNHLGDAESDALTVHVAASTALLEAVPFVNASSAQMERLAQLIDGDRQESDPAARELLKNALHKASLGPDEALDLLYEEVGYRPTALPSELFGPEHTTVVRQFALYKLERDRGPAGWATALTHLDNVAERLMRATYLRFGTHDKVKQRILESPREPDYGNLLTACEGSLLKPRESFLVLHRLRGEETEVPHPGTPTTQATWDMANGLFQKGALTCLAMLNQPAAKP
jgi:hypothetical protein